MTIFVNAAILNIISSIMMIFIMIIVAIIVTAGCFVVVLAVCISGFRCRLSGYPIFGNSKP